MGTVAGIRTWEQTGTSRVVQDQGAFQDHGGQVMSRFEPWEEVLIRELSQGLPVVAEPSMLADTEVAV